MRSSASLGRFHDDHHQRSTGTAGLPGSGRARTDSAEPATLATLQKEIALLRQTVDALWELAHPPNASAPHTQKVTAHWLDNAKNPVQWLDPGCNRPPAELGLTRSQPRRPANGEQQPLTRTEEAVLRRLATTLSLREISQERYVSRDTIKSQVRSIYRKLGVSNRHEAVQRGRELGLLIHRRRLSAVV